MLSARTGRPLTVLDGKSRLRNHNESQMTVSAPFSRSMRQATVSLTDDVLDRIDALRIIDGMPSRSAMLAELIELGLAFRENPVDAVAVIIEALETAAGIDPAAETAADPLDAGAFVPLKDVVGRA